MNSMAEFLFKAEVNRLSYPEAQAQFPDVWPQYAEVETETIWDFDNPYFRELLEADHPVTDCTEKNRTRKAKRYNNLCREKQERIERKKASLFSNWDPKRKRYAKRYSHKVVRQGRMPRTDYYLISGTQYCDGKYHNSYKAVV